MLAGLQQLKVARGIVEVNTIPVVYYVTFGHRAVKRLVNHDVRLPRCSLTGAYALVAVTGLPPAVERHQAIVEVQFPRLTVSTVVHHEQVVRLADDLVAAGDRYFHQLSISARFQCESQARYDLPVLVKRVDPVR